MGGKFLCLADEVMLESVEMCVNQSKFELSVTDRNQSGEPTIHSRLGIRVQGLYKTGSFIIA